MPRVLSFGSLNIDLVYRVASIVRPGQTIASKSMAVFAGGKGANQSVALARAGAQVHHGGRVGEDGRWLIDKLAAVGVRSDLIVVDAQARTGSAVIQIDDAGENAILLNAGANHAITEQQIEAAVAAFGAGDVLLLQNEVSHTAELIRAGKARGMTVCLNPAPMTDEVTCYPLDQVNLLIVNEHEGEALTGTADPDAIAARLTTGYNLDAIVTLGAAGSLHRDTHGTVTRVDAVRVDPVDTTAAGDTYIGYFLASRLAGLPVEASMRRAANAAAICVSRPGAADAIPARQEVDHA